MQDKLEQKYNEKIRQLIPINCLSPEFQDQALSQAEVVMVPSGNRLFEQGSLCESLYFLLSGEVSLSQDRELVKVISAGDESSRFAINKTSS